MRVRILTSALLFALSCAAQVPAGRWDGTIVAGTLKIPFRIDFEGSGSAMRAVLINGESRLPSTSGSIADGQLRLYFERTGTRVEATLADGKLDGRFETAKGVSRPFTATAFCSCGFEGEAGPDISGIWEVPDAGWRLTIQRKGEDTFLTLLRPEGELGPLAGRFDGAAFSLHYFDGPRAALIEIEPKSGRLDLVLQEPNQAVRKYSAVAVRRAL